jgi:hypothetical protein
MINSTAPDGTGGSPRAGVEVAAGPSRYRAEIFFPPSQVYEAALIKVSRFCGATVVFVPTGTGYKLLVDLNVITNTTTPRIRMSAEAKRNDLLLMDTV